MIIGLIPIYKGNFFERKMEKYHQTIEMIIKSIFKLHSGLTRNSLRKSGSKKRINDVHG